MPCFSKLCNFSRVLYCLPWDWSIGISFQCCLCTVVLLRWIHFVWGGRKRGLVTPWVSLPPKGRDWNLWRLDASVALKRKPQPHQGYYCAPFLGNTTVREDLCVLTQKNPPAPCLEDSSHSVTHHLSPYLAFIYAQKILTPLGSLQDFQERRVSSDLPHKSDSEWVLSLAWLAFWGAWCPRRELVRMGPKLGVHFLVEFSLWN